MARLISILRRGMYINVTWSSWYWYYRTPCTVNIIWRRHTVQVQYDTRRTYSKRKVWTRTMICRHTYYVEHHSYDIIIIIIS